ncbi:MAG: hypothetical protein FWG10_08775 [Eubacteriaceae bacterium]|nr:hypothetical protein [Eubacteriaceae bacterium]
MGILQERIQLVRDATNFKKTSRIPTYSNYWTYMVLDAGYLLSDALYDYDKMYHAVTRFVEKYNFDFYNYTGGRNPFRVTDIFQANRYMIDDERGAFNIQDHENMSGDEYVELAKDPLKFMWETLVPRKAKLMNAPNSLELFVEAVKEYDLYTQFTSRVAKDFIEKYGIPQKSSQSLRGPFDTFFSHMRGIKGLSIDMRRNPEGLEQGLAAMHEYFGLDAQTETFINNPVGPNAIYGGSTAFLGHSICSPKQFNKYTWEPYMSKWLDICVEKGKQFTIFSEAQITTFADFFQDVPKGVLMIQPEQDDLFELRKLLPNVALCGGMTTVSLGLKSVGEALDLAKKLVDELGSNGGFIMGQNKMMTYRNDAKPENILAVQEFCEAYKP